MPDLIDRENLINELSKRMIITDINADSDSVFEGLEQIPFVTGAIAIANNMPSVDAEHVVHCKDCMEYKNGSCNRIAYIMDGYYAGEEERNPDDYCSKGVQKL